jgi:hypothetical protein
LSIVDCFDELTGYVQAVSKPPSLSPSGNVSKLTIGENSPSCALPASRLRSIPLPPVPPSVLAVPESRNRSSPQAPTSTNVPAFGVEIFGLPFNPLRHSCRWLYFAVWGCGASWAHSMWSCVLMNAAPMTPSAQVTVVAAA